MLILVSLKTIFDLLKDTKNWPCHLTKCSAKPEKAGKDSADQEWPANLQPTLNNEGDHASHTIFAIDCRSLAKSSKILRSTY